MAKQFADFIQGRTLPDHARCQTMAEEVSTLACGLHSRSVECTPNHSADRLRAGKLVPRSPVANEHSSTGATGATMAQVQRKSFTYIRSAVEADSSALLSREW